MANFCSGKDTIKRRKRQMGWEEIFAKHVSGKGLVSETHKELLKLNSKKTSHLKIGQKI